LILKISLLEAQLNTDIKFEGGLVGKRKDNNSLMNGMNVKGMDKRAVRDLRRSIIGGKSPSTFINNDNNDNNDNDNDNDEPEFNEIDPIPPNSYSLKLAPVPNFVPKSKQIIQHNVKSLAQQMFPSSTENIELLIQEPALGEQFNEEYEEQYEEYEEAEEEEEEEEKEEEEEETEEEEVEEVEEVEVETVEEEAEEEEEKEEEEAEKVEEVEEVETVEEVEVENVEVDEEVEVETVEEVEVEEVEVEVEVVEEVETDETVPENVRDVLDRCIDQIADEDITNTQLKEN
jgi:glutamyl/glutaminyl-tRNA synthetase